MIPLLSLAACTSNDDNKPTTSKRGAQSAFAATTRVLDGASRDSNNLASTVSYKGPCPTSGTIDVDGSFDGSDDGQHANLDVKATFAACAVEQDVLDGDVHVKFEQNLAEYEASLTGDLDWTGPDGSASCAFDLHVKAGTAGYAITGSVCGYDVDDLDIDDLDLDLRF